MTEPDEEIIDVPEELTIDLSEVAGYRQLHGLLRQELQFPLWYGHNWAALWDAIRGLVPLPKRLTFAGWEQFATRRPEDAGHLRAIFDRYAAEYGGLPAYDCDVTYR